MFEQIFTALFNISLEFSKSVDIIIEWLNTPLNIGFDLPLIGFVGLSLGSPLTLLASGILILIGFWVIKNLVPFL